MALPAFLRKRWVRVMLFLLAAAVLCAALVATIYLKVFDLLAFLGGVLFAAVLAMASQISRSEWRAERSTTQLERLRELDRETARSRNTAEAMRITEARMRLVSDALPSLILFVDREERCRYHNRAVKQQTGLGSDGIDGHPLRDVIGNAVYLNVLPHISEVLAGKTVDYEITWGTASGGGPRYAARHVPYFADDPQPLGFYLLLTRAAVPDASPAPGPLAVPEPAANSGVDALPASAEGEESLYLRSIVHELMGWDDPRAKLARALEENQFLLFAQKILSLKSGAADPVCFEILLRLQEEEDNLFPPGGFIPIAEQYGMVQELDHWVVRTLISWCVEKQRADPGWRVPLYCVNVSEATLSSPEFARFVRSELQRSNFPGRSLSFEIGEQDVINHHADVERLIAALKPVGCRFTIDGFGSVKVSFSHLKGLPVDFIKIDGIITLNILRNPAELAKMRGINTVCQKMNIRTIAEFVETTETLARLREAGVDYVQGFGIAPPAPIAQQG